MKKCSIIFALALLWAANVSAKKKVESDPNVVIPGFISMRGVLRETKWTNSKYMSFLDLRYAYPIDKENRFAPPVPLTESEDDVFPADQESLACPNLKTLENIDATYNETIEDCLYLTVSTKSLTGSAPVMVHLAGWNIATEENSNDQSNPGFLLEEDVVLVAVQYRVGPFGFLSTMTNDIPGNVGILDVIEALRWVNKYISHFGGNPKQVTLFGQFHSASIAHILTMSPLLEKEELFHKVIYQSGSALMSNLINTDAKAMVKTMAQYLNIESEDIAEINKGLKEASAFELLRAYKQVVGKEKLYPLIVVGDPNGVLPEEPKVMLKKRLNRAYPTLGGVVEQPSVCLTENMDEISGNRPPKSEDDNSDESSEEDKDERLIAGKKKKPGKDDINSIQDLITSSANVFKDVLILDVPANGDQAKYIENLFPKKIFASSFIKNILPSIIDIHSLPIKEATLKALKYNIAKGGKAYLYAFNYNPDNSFLSCGEDVYVVQLRDDDIFLFPQEDISLTNLSKKERRLARLMVELWTSFARTGQPEAHSLHVWPPLEFGLNGPYFIIDVIHKLGFDYTEEYFSGLRAQKNEIDIVEL